MKKFFILLIIGIFTIPINAQRTQANLDYLKSARRKIGTGATLTLVGVGTMVGGIVIYANGLNEIIDNESSDYNTDKAFVGIGVMVVGEILIDVGLPFWIVGAVQKGRANRKLQLSMVQFKSPYNHASINGIGLKIRF